MTPQQLAEQILENQLADDLYAFSAIMHSLGDTRWEAVRNHARCCFRAYNIVSTFVELGICNTLWTTYQEGEPKDWKCNKSCCVESVDQLKKQLVPKK